MQQNDNETTIRGPFSVNFGSLLTAPPNRFDLALLPIILAAIVLVAFAAKQMNVPCAPGETQLDVSLDVVQLPYYLLRTSIRMLLALAASLAFSFAFAAIASKNRTAEKLLVPEACVAHRGDLPTVAVVGDNDILHYRVVKTGASYLAAPFEGKTYLTDSQAFEQTGGERFVDVLSGLTAGERVACDPGATLREGDRLVEGAKK